MPKEKSAVASAAAPLPLGASLQNGLSVANLQQYFLERRTFALAKDEYTATPYDNFMTAAYAIRDRMIERWIKTQQRYHKQNMKRVYYLSMEFLIGRLFMHGVQNLGIEIAVERNDGTLQRLAATPLLSLNWFRVITSPCTAWCGA